MKFVGLSLEKIEEGEERRGREDEKDSGISIFAGRGIGDEAGEREEVVVRKGEGLRDRDGVDKVLGTH